MSEREVLEHLFNCFDTTYRVLGESVSRVENDAYAIRVYESARAMGEVALIMREEIAALSTVPITAISETLEGAVSADPSGAMVLFAMATLVGPRLLVSLRDARDSGSLDEGGLAASEFASATTIREILAIGDVAERGEVIEDESWQRVARALNDRLESSGNAESFGVSL